MSKMQEVKSGGGRGRRKREEGGEEEEGREEGKRGGEGKGQYIVHCFFARVVPTHLTRNLVRGELRLKYITRGREQERGE